MSGPFHHHKMRLAAGLSVHAEVMLDLCSGFRSGCSHIELKQLAIAEGVGSPATLHYAIHNLIDAGLLASAPNPRDARAQLLTVTPAGKLFLKGKQ